MEDRILLKVALVCAVVGVTALFFVSRQMEVDAQPIEQIKLVEGEVAIEGEVRDVFQKGSLTVIDVGYDTSMKVVLFEQVDVRVGDKVGVRGRVKEYNGQLELVGEELRVI